MARVLVTEVLADAGLDVLKAAGHQVEVRLDLDRDGLIGALQGVDALLVRSATKVTAEVLEAADSLVVVGRAGIGLDNVDVEAATRRGVIVANAPESNIITVAEHTMALLLSVARHVPQAHSALVAGRWEKSKWEGVELHGKTLGVLGLGRIGALVAQRAAAFSMRVVAYDPYVSAEKARQLGAELVDLPGLVAEADFITIHLPKTADTVGLVGKELLAKTKPGAFVVNVARGGIIDEDALYEALADGRLGGAALDVFATEPLTESPLLGLGNVVVTPHLGASTTEAQDKAGVTVAEQVNLALAGDFVPFAVNLPAGHLAEAVKPFVGVAETLGSVFARLCDGMAPILEVSYEGALAEHDTGLLTLSVLKGLFAASEPVSYVNARTVAAERGVEVRETTSTASHDWVSLITVCGGGHSVAGTAVGASGAPRLVMVDGHDVDAAPYRHMLLVRNDDRPGMIGAVGTAVGDAGVSIRNMAVGQSPEGGTALMILATETQVPDGVVERLGATPGIAGVRRIAL
ncbi:MAG TPA: phosphoglycerate dehydrogenase [Acidimicrobiales bacterium]|nr:phosphoglycerate dehydrogenase [Acidimicrobiales bacterium]